MSTPLGDINTLTKYLYIGLGNMVSFYTTHCSVATWRNFLLSSVRMGIYFDFVFTLTLITCTGDLEDHV